jgi:hypothetical protein
MRLSAIRLILRRKKPLFVKEKMKRCPQCRAEYSDETLRFCLEDGTELNFAGKPTEAATEFFSVGQKSTETLFFERGVGVPQTLPNDAAATAKQDLPSATQPSSLKQKTVEKGYRALEVGTLVFALALNWWQWLYVDRQHYGSIPSFLLSAEFLIWLLLLLAGTTSGLLTLKFSRKKELAYAGLIILAINFLLLLVPRR